jgi:hypothetical protein
VLLAGFAVAQLVAAFAAQKRDASRLGHVLAIGAACAHALVNFVFFSLPLMLLMGVQLSCATETADQSVPILRGRLFNVFVGFGWICFAYLLLDLTTAVVLQGQPGFPIGSLRSDPHNQLRYARFAEQLNGSRGVPVLAQAVLLSRLAELSDGMQDVNDQALATYRRALRVDPWNTIGYVAMADFIEERRAELLISPDEEPGTLLLSAIAINPIEIAAIDRLLRLQETQGRLSESYGLLRNVVYPWIELMKRQDPEAADRYLSILTRLAAITGDSSFVAEIASKRAALANVTPAKREGWYF